MILLLIIIIGFILRLIGLWFGLPYFYHADEPIIINQAMALGINPLHPCFYAIPPLASYIVFVCYGIMFLFSNLSPTQFGIQFLIDPTVFILIARCILGVIPGTATIYMLYVFAKEITQKKDIAIGSALLLSVNYLHVQQSHYAYVDILLTLFMLYTAWRFFLYKKHTTIKNTIFLGFGIGLCTAIKYNGLVILSLGIFNIFSLLIGALVFCILNFSCIINFTQFKSNLITQGNVQHYVGIVHHIIYSLGEGMNIALLFYSAFGMGSVFIKRKLKQIYIIVFIITWYFSITFFGQYHERYVLVLIPFLIFFAVQLLHFIMHKKKLFFYFILFIVSVFFSFLCVLSDTIMCQKDTRTQAKEWIEKNIPENAIIALDHSFFCPRLNSSYLQNTQRAISTDKLPALKARLIAQINKKPAYYLYYLTRSGNNSRFLFEQPNLPFNVEMLQVKKIEYVVVHYSIYSKWHEKFCKELAENAVLIKRFSPYRDQKKGYSKDKIIQTGTVFLPDELMRRTCNGYVIEVWKLFMLGEIIPCCLGGHNYYYMYPGSSDDIKNNREVDGISK